MFLSEMSIRLLSDVTLVYAYRLTKFMQTLILSLQLMPRDLSLGKPDSWSIPKIKRMNKKSVKILLNVILRWIKFLISAKVRMKVCLKFVD